MLIGRAQFVRHPSAGRFGGRTPRTDRDVLLLAACVFRVIVLTQRSCIGGIIPIIIRATTKIRKQFKRLLPLWLAGSQQSTRGRQSGFRTPAGLTRGDQWLAAPADGDIVLNIILLVRIAYERILTLASLKTVAAFFGQRPRIVGHDLHRTDGGTRKQSAEVVLECL